MKRAFLPPSLMITSIIGFIICGWYTMAGASIDPDEFFANQEAGTAQIDSFEAFFLQYGPGFENFGNSLGVASCVAFIIMFIASFVSMTPSEHELGLE